MPKRARSTKGRKRSEKKYRRSNFSTAVRRGVRSKGLFRPSSKVTMRFVETAQLDADSSGTLTIEAYRFNSPYDPSTSTSTHQPMGFDQYMQFFEHFVVTSASIRVQFSNLDGVPNKLVTLTRNNISATKITNYVQASEQVGSQSKLLGGAFNTVTFTDKINMNEHFATNVVQERGYWGTAIADPAESGTWEIGVCSADGSNPTAIQYLVDITYVVTLKEPRPLVGS